MSYKAEVTLTKREPAEIDEWEVKRLACEIIITTFDLPRVPFIEHDNLCEIKEEWYGSHSNVEKIVIRKATETDIAAVKVFHQLMPVGWR